MAEEKTPNFGIIRDAFSVRRFHTVHPLLIPETVGHHTANVIATLFFLYDGKPPIDVIWAALMHDVAEVVTGDVPAPAKWAFPMLDKALNEAESIVRTDHGLAQKGLTEEDTYLIKFADMFDLCMHALDELSAGNATFDIILGRGLYYLRKLVDGPLRDNDRAVGLIQHIMTNHYISVDEVLKQHQMMDEASSSGTRKH